MGDEKRRRSRVCAHFDAYVYADGARIPVSSQNISLKGALFCPEPRLHEGRECTVVFELSQDVTVRLKGVVVRSTDTGTAIDFESMDETAFFHLRNMVRYSAQDADVIDNEMQVPAFSPHHPGDND